MAVAAFGAAFALADAPELARERVGRSIVVVEVPAPDGANATWVPDPGVPLSATATEVIALVTRTECSGGTTGQVLAPDIRRTPDEVVITFKVDRLPPGMYNCPGNDSVRYEVDLGAPLGRRRLVDGLCLLSGPVVETSFCESDRGIRWRP
jgi:hypothetical protein